MRFLFLTQYFPPEVGAPQIRLASMIRELTRLGHEVEVITALPNYPTGRIFPEYRGKWYCRETWEGVPIRRVWLYASTGAGFRRMLNYGSFTFASLVGLMGTKRPDYIFVESPPLFLSIPGWVASVVRRSRFIFNVADLWPDSVRELGFVSDGWMLRLAERIEAWSYRKAAFVNAVTEGIRQNLIEKKGVSPEKVLFLPNGVDTELFRPMKPDEALARELGLTNKKVVLYAGTQGFANGLEVALEAAKLLADTDVVFVLIGDGSEKKRLQKMARGRGVENVHFLDPASPEYVARLYSLALAGFSSLRNLPLFDGARPSKIFPAMASGKPVIYSGAGEGARLIEYAKAGLVVPPEDPVALAKAVRKLTENLALAEDLGRNGRQYVDENLSWKILITDWLRQLEKRSKDHHDA